MVETQQQQQQQQQQRRQQSQFTDQTLATTYNLMLTFSFLKERQTKSTMLSSERREMSSFLFFSPVTTLLLSLYALQIFNKYS